MTAFAARVGVYGVGHFGYALLRYLGPRAGGEISLHAYDRDPAVRASLRTRGRHPFHDAPAPLDSAVEIVESVAALLSGVDTVILAVTSHSTREVAQSIASAPWPGPLLFVNTAKALDYMSGRRLSEVFREQIPRPPHAFSFAALSGGTIADDLLLGNPLGMTIASPDPGALPRLARLFGSPRIWVQTTTDLVGVEYSGALKNVIAICAGMVRGLGHSFGAETHLISRMASEVEEFCVARLGADRRTFSIGSQCWGSDLWMSCTGPTRNRALGELLGKGLTLDDANRRMAAEHKTVEGVQTLRAMETILREHPSELPLLRAAERVILRAAPPETLIEAMMRSDSPEAGPGAPPPGGRR